MQRKWQRRWQRLVKNVLPPLAAGMVFFSVYNSVAWASPTDGNVTVGSGTITATGKTTTINQTSDKLSINWQSFSIASGETVNFVQPSSSAVALNRVVGSSSSAIYGALNANGKVFLINPNGILFSSSAQVNVGSLVASTLQLSDSNFLKENYTFTSGGTGSVINQGTIQTTDGGYVALLGNQVNNEGVILANKGSVALAAGAAATLDFTGDGLINLNVSQAALDAQVSNIGLVQANGGLVAMTAKAAGDLTGTVVNNTGIIRAQSISERNGKIVLDGGDTGVVSVSGTLDASGKTSGLAGGTVKVLGNEVQLTSLTRIDVSGDKGGGIALIGGAYQGGSSEKSASATTVETGATITADAINSGNGGQVVVWSNDTTKYDGTITARGGTNSGDGGYAEVSGKRILTFTGTVDLRANNGKTGNLLLDPYNLTISNSTDSNITGTSATGNDSEMNVTTLIGLLSSANVTVSTGSGGSQDGNITVAVPVSWSSDSVLTLSAAGNIVFNAGLTATGTNAGLVLEYGAGKNYILNGNPITLSGSNASLQIGESGALQTYTLIHSMVDFDAIDTTGLNGNYALVQDLNAGGTIYTAALVGTGSSTAFSGTFAGLGHTVSNLVVHGTANYTGLFGYSTGTIRDIGVTSGNITNTSEYTGGLAGYNTGTITNSYYSGDVDGNINVGGLVGSNNSGTISYSHSSGTVKSTGVADRNIVGGLVGSSYTGTISDSYSESTVTSLFSTGISGYQGNYVAGGLVGAAWNGGTISNSYATGTVNGSSTIGGLVGVSFAAIDNSYSESAVNATSNDAGGLVGVNYGAISNSHSTGVVTATKINDVNDTVNASNDIGGLVGANYTDGIHTGTITNSYSIGNVQGTGWVGGLVGYNDTNASISGSYSTGNVDGYYSVGGLAGTNAGGSIDTSHSEGIVTGANRIGGLVGKNSGSITNSYSESVVTRTGSVSVISSTEGLAIGGLVGYNTGTISSSYSSGTVTSNDTGVTNSTGGTLTSYVGGLVGNNQGTISNLSYSTSAVYSHVGNSSSGISTYYAGALVGKNQTSANVSANSTASGITVLYVDSPLSLTNRITLVSSGDIEITSPITSSDSLYLDAGGKITESDGGKFVGDYLKAYANGVITLTGDNNVNYFSAISGNHNIYFHDVLPAGEQLNLGSGDSTIYIDAGTGNFYLTVDGSLNAADVASHVNIENKLIADGLYIYGPNCRFWLYGSDYIHINTLAANVGTMAIADSDGFTIGSISGSIGTLSGITSTGIWNGSTLLNSSIGLESDATITQTAPINVVRLLLGKGNFILDNSSNHVGSLATYSYSMYSTSGGDNTAAKTNGGTGNITYRDSGNLLIDTDVTYGDTAAILASGMVNLEAASIGFTNSGGLGINAQHITLKSSGDISLTSSVIADYTSGVITLESAGGNVTDTSGITVSAHGLLLKGAGADYNLTTANYNVGLLAADTGSIAYSQTGGISIDTVAGVSGIKATGDVSITTPSPASGSATIYINKPIVITSSSPATLTLSSGNDVILNQNSALTADNVAVNMILASNLSGSGGYVRLLQGSSVTTNGGDLTIGGGVGASDYAVAADPYNYEGVWIATSTINTGAGDITIHGKGYNGIRINGGSLTTTSGSITLDGIGDESGGTGVFIKSYAGLDGNLQPTIPTVISTNTGNITITGASNNSNTESLGNQYYFTGVNIWSDDRDLTETTSYKGVYITSGNGDITITGYRLANDSSATGNTGVSLSTLTLVETTGTGNILISNDSGSATVANEIGIRAAGVISASGSGTITLKGLNGVQLAGGSITATDTVVLAGTGTITQLDNSSGTVSGQITAENLLLQGNGANYTLTSTSNQFSTIAASGAGNVSVYDRSALTVGTVDGNEGIDATGIVKLATGSGSDITLAKAIVTTDSSSTSTDGAITLLSGQNFINNAGSNALRTGNGGNWLVYSADPSANIIGGVSYNFKQYNAAYGDAISGTGNGFVYTLAPQVTVDLTGTINKTYDGTDAATVSGGNYAISGNVSGDTLVLNNTSASYADKNANSNKTVKVDGLSIQSATDSTGASVYGYSLTGTMVSKSIGTIAKATISAVTGITAADKVYDGTTTTTLTTNSAAFSGLVAGDNLSVSTATGSFADKNAGDNKTIAISGITLGGSDAGNYTLTTSSASTTASISKATISAVTGITAADKVYDGTTGATLTTTNAGFSGLVSGDSLSVSTAIGSFADKNAGDNKTVTISGITLSGSDAGNYTLATSSADTTATISKATISAVTGITVADKVYDGTTASTLTTTNAGFNGLVSGDSLSVSTATGSFADKNAGTNKTVTINGITLGGSDAGNYTLATDSASTTATISKATISAVTGITAADKVYDGTTASTLTTINAGFNGLVSGDSLSVFSATGSFADKNAGTNKTVTISGITLGGSDAGNYTLATSSATTQADITPRDLTITAIGQNKKYDGKTTAMVTYGDDRISTDSLTVIGSATFVDANPGSNKAITISSLTATGTDAGNYTLVDNTTGITATIFPDEKIEVAVKYSNSQVTPLQSAVGAEGNHPPTIEIVQTGSNQNGIMPFLPTSVTMTTAGGQTTGYSVTVSNNGVTLSRSSESSSATTSQSSIAVFTANNGGNSVTSFAVTVGDGSLTVSGTTAAASLNGTSEPAGTAASTSCSLMTSDGQTAQFQILYENNAISISPLNQAAATINLNEGSFKEMVVASGMLAAQQNLGADLQFLTAVYIH